MGSLDASKGIVKRVRDTTRRLEPWSQELQWVALGALGAVGLVLGYIGLHSALSARGEPSALWAVLYGDLQLFVLEPGAITGEVPWQLDVARLLVPTVAALAAVKGLTLLLRDDWLLFRGKIARNHVIVCGLGRRGLRLSRSLVDRGDRVVVVEADAENHRIRAAQRAGIGTLTGDATDPDVLRRAGIGRASRLISVCGDDGTDASVAAAARELARGRSRGRSLACMININDNALCELMRGEQIAAAERIPFRLDVFNMFEDGARAMLVDHPVAVEGGPEHPHVIVVGLGWLGEPLVAEIALSWLDGGLERHRPLAITLVDLEAEERRRSMLIRHPWIEGSCSVRSATIDVRSPEFESGGFLDDERRPWRWGPRPPGDGILAYVCLDDTSLALDAALALRKRAGERARIVVRTETDEGLGSLLHQRATDGGPGIVPFPLIDRVCDADAVIGFTFTERIARQMHADYVDHRWRKETRAEKGEREAQARNDGDPSMRPWEVLDEELRESNRDAARDIGHKLRVVGCEAYALSEQEPPEFAFTGPQIELLARMEHERWIADQQRMGWRRGAPKDLEAKVSPHLIPFDRLSREIQDYDRDAVRSLPRILAEVGYGIRTSRGSRRAPVSGAVERSAARESGARGPA